MQTTSALRYILLVLLTAFLGLAFITQYQTIQEKADTTNNTPHQPHHSEKANKTLHGYSRFGFITLLTNGGRYVKGAVVLV
jgi:hypothetical protein